MTATSIGHEDTSSARTIPLAVRSFPMAEDIGRRLSFVSPANPCPGPFYDSSVGWSTQTKQRYLPVRPRGSLQQSSPMIRASRSPRGSSDPSIVVSLLAVASPFSLLVYARSVGGSYFPSVSSLFPSFFTIQVQPAESPSVRRM